MMTIKKGMLAAAALATFGTGAVGITSVFAAGNPPNHAAGMENLVQALADKFGVSTDEVQAVFDEQRAEKEADQEQRATDRLAQAVTDGTLTQEQADAITAHRDEVQAFRSSLKDMTSTERANAISTQREANKTWAEENNIPENFTLHGNHGHNRHNR